MGTSEPHSQATPLKVDGDTDNTYLTFEDYVVGEATQLASTLRVVKSSHASMESNWREPNGTDWKLTLEKNLTVDEGEAADD